MAGVRLHKEHGLNPTIPHCFWCGKAKNEIVLLGAAYKGQAPMGLIVDYTPCDDCQAQRDLGITFMEIVDAKQTANPPMAKDGALSTMAPTGRWCVVREEALETFIEQPLLASILKTRWAVVEKAVFEMLVTPNAQN